MATLFMANVAGGATLIAEPGEAGFRAAIAAAQDGDTIFLANHVGLQSRVQIDKRLTIRSESANPNSGRIGGDFEGELFHLTVEGIVFENINLSGSPQTDGLRVEKGVLLRDCSISWLRSPVAWDYSSYPETPVRLERVTVMFNENGFEVPVLEAKDSVFALNGRSSFMLGGTGANSRRAFLDGCRFEDNHGFGLIIGSGTVKNCTFRYNTGFGLWCDADPGDLSLGSSLFYANGDGGLFLGEQVFATVDNCTFTRHSGSAAILVQGDVTGASFRHCTVADNAFYESEPMPRQRTGSAAFTIERPGSVTLQNCLVADNPTNGSPYAASLSAGWIDGGGNIIGGPARLNVLASNGGPTLSMMPLSNSPAIDAGISSELIVDARGLSRLAGSAPDAGAIETDASPLADGDGDGLPDLWELFYGLNPGDPTDAFSDTDRDGQAALAEFRSRTHPADAESSLRLKEIYLWPEFPDPGIRTAFLVWDASRGLAYEVETSTDLREWRRAQWGHPYNSASGRGTLYLAIPAESPMVFFRLKVRDTVFD